MYKPTSNKSGKLSTRKIINTFKIRAIRSFFDLLAFITFRNLSPLVAVGAIIENRNAILFLERSDGLGLCFPGGLIKWRETPHQALQREVAEETGYRVNVGELIGAYGNPENDPRFACIVLIYTAVIVGGRGRSSPEGKLRWIHNTRLPHTLAFNHRSVLRDYLEKTRLRALQREESS